MTRAQMITIVVIAALVVIGGVVLLLFLLRPPDYALWRKQLTEVRELAEGQLSRTEQVGNQARRKLQTYREQIQTVQEESGYISGMLGDFGAVMRQVEQRLARLSAMTGAGTELTLGDGKKYTVEQLQTLTGEMDRAANQVRTIQLSLQGDSQNARGALQALRQEITDLTEMSRSASEKLDGLNLAIKELTELIEGPDEKLPTAKRFPRVLKEQREIVGNLTEDIDEVVRGFQGAVSRQIELPSPSITPQDARKQLTDARQLAQRLATLIR